LLFVDRVGLCCLFVQDGSDSSDQEDEKTTIKAKYRLFQSILVIVQTVLGEVADMEEGIRK